jgi:hypothetical protein
MHKIGTFSPDVMCLLIASTKCVVGLLVSTEERSFERVGARASVPC